MGSGIDNKKKVALFIMPRSSSAWKGSEALWITVAGWASAAEHTFGEAWVLTTDRCATPAEAMNFPLGNNDGEVSNKSRLIKFIPTIAVTLMKDVRLWFNSKKHSAFRNKNRWEGKSIVFVWEHHDIFPGPGRRLAKELNVPFIKYVHAPQVWELAKWGVKRPLWGQLLEKFSEVQSLNQATLVACVSKEVCDQLKIMGVKEDKILVSPMAVDPQPFISASRSSELIKKHNLTEKFVIGWTGSFRNFHGLDLLILAYKKVAFKFPDCVLLLVGDGLERKKLEELVLQNDLNGLVIFAGRKSFTEIPSYVALFDVAVVSARSAEGFHYSPLKLREYLAAGKPTLAPRAGEIPVAFQDGKHLLLYEAGNIESLFSAIVKLRSDASFGEVLGRQGKAHVLATGTWAVELEKVVGLFNTFSLRN